MRTKTVEMVIDRAFWALVLIMPVLAYLIINHHGSTDFITVLSQFNVTDTNLIYTTLVDIFGSSGYLSFFDTSTVNPILLYMSFFFAVEVVHVIVDVLLFIPKITVEILDKASSTGRIR